MRDMLYLSINCIQQNEDKKKQTVILVSIIFLLFAGPSSHWLDSGIMANEGVSVADATMLSGCVGTHLSCCVSCVPSECLH